MKWCLLLPVACFLSCANPVAPTGGDKDTAPPFLTWANPDTFATKVNSGKITIQFNEWIELRNPSREVLISPPQKTPPDIWIKGKGLEIQWKDSLLPNTTYMVQFGKSVVDFTEGNAASGLSYVFSTGEMLDSGWVEMRLLDAFTKRPIPQAALMAFRSPNDSLPYKEKPDFVAFSDENGLARLPYLPDVLLRLFALKESVTDYLYKPGGSEQIGFFPEPVPSLGRISDTLLLFFERPEEAKVLSLREEYPGKVYFLFNKEIDRLAFSCLPDSLNQNHRLEWSNLEKDSLVFWLGGPNYPDSMVFLLEADGACDTLVYRPPPLPPNRNKRGGDEGPYLFKAQKPSEKILFSEPMALSFTHGLSEINPQKIQLKEDSVLLEAEFYRAGSKLLVDFSWKPGTQYALLWADSAIKDVYGLHAAKDSIAFSTLETRDLVQLEVRLTGLPMGHDWLLFAVSEGKNKATTAMPLTLLPPRQGADSLGKEWNAKVQLRAGGYKLRLVQDLNGNGQWDSGRLLPKQLPEPVYYSGNSIQLKSGFDQIQRWDWLGRDRPKPANSGASGRGAPNGP